MREYQPLVIRLKDAEWDLSARKKLQFLLAAASDRPRVFIDMSAVTFMDATCLGKLASMQGERFRNGGLRPATLIIAYSNVRRLFTLVGFDKVWPIFGTLDEALSGDSPLDDLPYREAM
jgi:anti-anti-sigma regulatory factor